MNPGNFDMVSYEHPEKVTKGSIGGRPVLTTPQEGKVVVDSQMLSLWEFANGRDLETIIGEFKPEQNEPDEIRAGLACLAEAGLLRREPETEPDIYSHSITSESLVSVVIVAFNSLEWLPDCLASIYKQTHSTVELVIIDNASSDGTREWINQQYPQATYQYIDEVVSFSLAINKGVEISSGDFVLLLNPDTVLEQNAISEMLNLAESNPRGTVVPKLRYMGAPAFLNGIGNRVDPFSWGVDNGLGHLDLGQLDSWNELPSACFAAALIPKQVWKEVGPADVKFPMYYEDSEWSYRARKLGFSILAAPKAAVLHAFGDRVPEGTPETMIPSKLENVVYGRLRFTGKLLDAYLEEYFLSYLVSDFANLLRYLITLRIKFVTAILRGYGRFLKDLPEIRIQRKAMQSRLVVSDKPLLALQRGMPETLVWRGVPLLTWDLVRNYYLAEIKSSNTRSLVEYDSPQRRPRLLIISHDLIGKKLAGPGMRYMELARALCDEINVKVANPGETQLEIPGVELLPYSEREPASLRKLVDNSDTVVVSSYLLDRFPFLERSDARIVIDLYDPFVLENLHYYLDEPQEAQEALNQQSVSITNQLVRTGDFFICGNERQRDYWLGVLTSTGRINPKNYNQDPSLRSLIDVVGIGYPDKPPNISNLLKGKHPSIPGDARIVLWGGGIWNWLDPITLIKAWPAVLKAVPKARLVFLGTRHPNPDIPPHKMAEEAQALAEEIGEFDKSIIFIEWLSYRDREALLSEADAGVSLHPVHIETRFSIRTRILDYIWAGLPIISTEGDITSEWIRKYGLGQVVAEGDASSVERALINILNRSKASWQEKFEAFGDAYCWEKVAAPLKKYCLTGGYAADRMVRGKELAGDRSRGQTWRLNWARARFIYRSEGWQGLSHRTLRYFQRRIANL